APFVIAHAEGLDRDNGIDLDIKTIEEFKDITSALGSGRADVGYSVGPGQALTMRQAEIPIKIIMVGDVSVGGDQILTGNDDIQSAEDLKGHSVGIETAT